MTHPTVLVEDTLHLAPAGSVQLQGWIGGLLDRCLSNRVMAQEIEPLVRPFRERFENHAGDWRCEYWGKWFTSAALGLGYQPNPERRRLLEQAVSELLQTQTPDGYLGTYQDSAHLGIWDAWGRKYVLLGLIAAYEFLGDPAALEAACRAADHLLSEAPPGQVNLAATGIDVLKGLAPSSLLEPLVRLYQLSGSRRYLDFASSLVGDWEKPNPFLPEGLRLVQHALAGTPPREIGSAKAYEMMSCFEGLCELYRATGKEEYRQAAVQFGQSLREHERMLVGSGSNQELWCDGARFQTEVLEQPLETCVTVTWMKLCLQLLRLTGDPTWADELEISLYNALAGAMLPEGDWWAYFSPLTGERLPSTAQHADVGLSCCVANGPRGLLLTPYWSVMGSVDGPVINLYAPGTAAVCLADGSTLNILQETRYPEDGLITLKISPDGLRRFSLGLRIPTWSRRTECRVNGESVACTPGSYCRIEREWAPGDTVVLELDLRGRAVPAPSGAPQLAVQRGPLVLALDSRLLKEQDIAVRLVVAADSSVELTPYSGKPASVWLAFEAPFEVRPTHYFNHHRVQIPMCDYASAGNAWSDQNLFRVWLPQPLFLRQAFVPNVWKLMAPEAKSRPVMDPVRYRF